MYLKQCIMYNFMNIFNMFMVMLLSNSNQFNMKNILYHYMLNNFLYIYDNVYHLNPNNNRLNNSHIHCHYSIINSLWYFIDTICIHWCLNSIHCHKLNMLMSRNIINSYLYMGYNCLYCPGNNWGNIFYILCCLYMFGILKGMICMIS